MTVKGALQAVQKPQASSGTHSGGSVTMGAGDASGRGPRSSSSADGGLGWGWRPGTCGSLRPAASSLPASCGVLPWTRHWFGGSDGTPGTSAFAAVGLTSLFLRPPPTSSKGLASTCLAERGWERVTRWTLWSALLLTCLPPRGPVSLGHTIGGHFSCLSPKSLAGPSEAPDGSCQPLGSTLGWGLRLSRQV